MKGFPMEHVDWIVQVAIVVGSTVAFVSFLVLSYLLFRDS